MDEAKWKFVLIKMSKEGNNAKNNMDEKERLLLAIAKIIAEVEPTDPEWFDRQVMHFGVRCEKVFKKAGLSMDAAKWKLIVLMMRKERKRAKRDKELRKKAKELRKKTKKLEDAAKYQMAVWSEINRNFFVDEKARSKARKQAIDIKATKACQAPVTFYEASTAMKAVKASHDKMAKAEENEGAKAMKAMKASHNKISKAEEWKLSKGNFDEKARSKARKQARDMKATKACQAPVTFDEASTAMKAMKASHDKMAKAEEKKLMNKKQAKAMLAAQDKMSFEEEKEEGKAMKAAQDKMAKKLEEDLEAAENQKVVDKIVDKMTMDKEKELARKLTSEEREFLHLFVMKISAEVFA
jgi:hypothetical protein